MQKNVHFIGSSQDDLRGFPEKTKREFGQGLYTAQRGGRALNALSMTGFGSTSVTELRSNASEGTFRCMFTAKFDEAIYVLHAFNKKSVSGIKTPKKEVDLIKSRLKLAERHYEQTYKIRERKERTKNSAIQPKRSRS